MIHKAKSPNITHYSFRGKVYKIYDAYEKWQTAKQYVKDLGTVSGRIYQYDRTSAIVVDLGKEAGRLRYGVFVAKGAKI